MDPQLATVTIETLVWHDTSFIPTPPLFQSLPTQSSLTLFLNSYLSLHTMSENEKESTPPLEFYYSESDQRPMSNAQVAGPTSRINAEASVRIVAHSNG